MSKSIAAIFNCKCQIRIIDCVKYSRESVFRFYFFFLTQVDKSTSTAKNWTLVQTTSKWFCNAIIRSVIAWSIWRELRIEEHDSWTTIVRTCELSHTVSIVKMFRSISFFRSVPLGAEIDFVLFFSIAFYRASTSRRNQNEINENAGVRCCKCVYFMPYDVSIVNFTAFGWM